MVNQTVHAFYKLLFRNNYIKEILWVFSFSIKLSMTMCEMIHQISSKLRIPYGLYSHSLKLPIIQNISTLFLKNNLSSITTCFVNVGSTKPHEKLNEGLRLCTTWEALCCNT